MNPRWLNNAIYALCLIAPWSLLWLDSHLLFPYTTGKAWVFRSLVELAFALSLVLRFSPTHSCLAQNSGGQLHRIALYLLLGFLGWTALTNVLGIDLHRSLWSNWERMGGLIDYLHWAMYLFSLLSVLDKNRSQSMLLNLVLVIALVSVLGYLDGKYRSISTLGNPIYLGNLAVSGMFILAFLLSTAHLNWQKGKLLLFRLLLALAMLVMFVALIKSAARGAAVALLAGGLAVVLCLVFERAWRRGKLAVLILSTVIFIFAGLLVSQLGAIQKTLRQSDVHALERLGRISMNNQTTADRLENWRIALDAAQSQPLTGWGQENYMIAFNEFYRAGVMDKAHIWFDRTHNAYLEILIASGIPGLFLYLMVLGSPILLLWRMPGRSFLEKSLMTGFFVAYLVKNLVGFDTFSSTLVWLSCFALVLTSGQTARQYQVSKPAPNGLLGIGVPVLALLMASLSIYWLNIRPYQDNLRFAELMRNPLALRSTQLDVVLEQSPAGLLYGQNAKLAVFDAMLVQAAKRKLTSIERKRMERTYLKAEQLIEEVLRRQPRNYRIKYNAALLFARTGRHEQALRMLEELTVAAPQRTVFWYTLSQLYGQTGQAERASNAREMAMSLNSSWKP